MDKIENEIINCLQLENMALKLEAMADNIETGDAYYNFSCLEKFPYFDGSQALETRNAALKEYLEMLIRAFVYSCKLINDATEIVALEHINSSVVHLCNVIALKKVNVQLLPMAKELHDLYNNAHAKLMRNGLKDNAVKFELLKKSIFLAGCQ